MALSLPEMGAKNSTSRAKVFRLEVSGDEASEGLLSKGFARNVQFSFIGSEMIYLSCYVHITVRIDFPRKL